MVQIIRLYRCASDGQEQYGILDSFNNLLIQLSTLSQAHHLFLRRSALEQPIIWYGNEGSDWYT